MDRSVFVDTAYAIALVIQDDVHHDRAVELANQMLREGTRFVTTRAVLFEIGNSLSRRYRQEAAELLRSFEDDPSVEILDMTRERCAEALDLFSSRPDKQWSLTDCLSFVIMNELGLRQALTADVHFEQAGFVALLRS